MRPRGSVFATALVLCVLALGPRSFARADTQLTLRPAISARIDEMARTQIHAGRSPGIVIGVVEDGRVVYARGFGFADISKHVPMTPDTEFYVGGITKQFTAAAVLLLAQDGKLSLDDRITKFVPEFRSAGAATIGQLLTETAGIALYAPLPKVTPDPTRPIKLSEVFTALDRNGGGATALPAPYRRNPLDYLIAGLIVERASGVPLSDYLEQHIFLPLIMNHSFLAGDGGISPSHAAGYTRSGRDFVTAPSWDPSWLGGSDGLVSTFYDLAKWEVEMPILLRVDAVRTMFAPTAAGGPTRYGMGWVIDRRGGKDFVWSNGEISGYRSMSALLPEQHIGVIVLSNADSFHGSVTTPEELGAHILDLIVPPTAARLDNTIVARAKEWLTMLASGHLERGELTPSFSASLTDDVVAKANFAALGPLLAILPISSTTEPSGNTMYEFLVRFRRGQYHYEFELTPQGKIDGITLTA